MRATDWLLLVILSVLWGGTFFFVGVAKSEVPTLTLVLARCAIAAAVLVPIVLALGMRLPRTWLGWRDFAIMAVINNIIPFALIFYGQTLIPSGIAAVLNGLAPLAALIVARIFAGEAIPGHKIAGILLGIAGIAILIGPEFRPGGTRQLVGMAAVVLAAISYGFSGLWSRRLKAYSPAVSSAAQMLCSGLLLIPIAGFADRFWTRPLPSRPVLAAVVALALLSTALAYVIFFRIIASAGATNAMLVTLLIPFSSIALGAAFLGETLTGLQIAGALVIGTGLLVIDGRLLGVAPVGRIA